MDVKNSQMADRFFCSAKNRPLFCKYNTNKCCLHCDMVESCTLMSKNYNKTHNFKSTLPCTSKNVGSSEICEFSC